MNGILQLLHKVVMAYAEARIAGYGSIGDQLDMLYKDIDAGKLNKNGAWYKFIKKVKEDNPKPE